MGEAVSAPRHSLIATGGRPVHWSALDGLRAFAVVAVLVYHWYLPYVLRGGLFGVDVFFVLSGFLITSLLIAEWEKWGSIGLKNFYTRRALRLFPALSAVVVLTVVAVLAISQLSTVRHQTLVGLPWVVFYVGNWLRVLHPANDPLGLLAHTWSLASAFRVFTPSELGVSTKEAIL
jgi:peptidoglycan/LPS O-acetylase OafA/YrhL